MIEPEVSRAVRKYIDRSVLIVAEAEQKRRTIVLLLGNPELTRSIHL
jgi:hypothetical protein